MKSKKRTIDMYNIIQVVYDAVFTDAKITKEM